MFRFLIQKRLCRIQDFRRSIANASSSGPEQATINGLKRGRPFLRLALYASGIGYVYYCYQNYKDAVAKESVYKVSPYKVMLYRALPLGCLTSMAGKFASLQIPEWLRSPLYGAYSKLYDCDLCECEGLKTFTTFNKFFTRRLNEGLRTVSKSSSLISPADGKILAFGRIEPGEELYPEQVKGIRYPLDTFLRIDSKSLTASRTAGNDLYYCSIYLAPGSYHRFHSPIDNFQVENIERIPGEVLPVAPWVLRLVPALVTLNERAVISGRWKHGKMYMVPVGATSVRSIKLRWPLPSSDDTIPPRYHEKLQKGDEVGQFEMGSLVALVFEAPKGLEWKVEQGSWIKYGAPLANTLSESSWWPFNN